MPSNTTLTTKQGMVARGAAWKVFAVVGSTAIALFLLRLPATLESSLLIGVSAATTLAMYFGLKTFRPRPIAAWILITIGQFFNCLGNGFFTHTYYLDHPNISPEISAGFYLIGMLGFFTGAIVLFGHFRKLIRRDTVAQGLIVAIGFSLLVWIGLIYPNLSRNLSPTAWVSIIIFPAGILAMGFPASMFLMTSLGDTWCYRFLLGVLMFYTIGLQFYGKLVSQISLNGVWSDPGLVVLTDMSYSTAYILLGIAYLHPSLGTLRSSLPNRTHLISRLELVVLGIAFAAAPFFLLVQSTFELSANVKIVIVGMLIVFGLIESRLALLLRVLESQNRQLSHQRAQLHHQAHHDALTDLPNRFFLYQYLNEVILRSHLSRMPGAVLMIDLNRFKEINDNFGHDAGDQVLREMATQLSKLKRKDDMVARWGGDEFVFILEGLKNAQDALAFARRLYRDVSYTVVRDHASISVTLSIGICMFSNDHTDIQNIMKRADVAMYRAKACPEDKVAWDEESRTARLVVE